MLQIRASRAGPLTAVKDGVALHSLYDPVREAERFVAAELGAEPAGTILVLGEVLGHIGRAAAAHSPGARVLLLFYDRELASRAEGLPNPVWHPGLGHSVQVFLRRELGVMDLEGLRVLEWGPSRSLQPAAGREAMDAVAQTVREINGSVTTIIGRGRRWLRNSVINALHAPAPLAGLPATRGRPIVVAGSGPSLEEAVGVLRRCRTGLSLWALPSAVCCLLAAGLEPDLVVMTDPVYWSLYHLHPAAGRDLAVAMPLAAAGGVWRVTRRTVYLGQATFYETELLRAIGVDALSVPPHGTVAGTALELALAATAAWSTPVIMAGLDLCARDIRDHCRPNAFETVLEPAVRRLDPLHHQIAVRTMEGQPRTVPGTDARTSLPLETYAGWFAAGQPSWAGRVRRLFPSPVAIPSMAPIHVAELESLAARADGGSPEPSAPAALPGAADLPSRRQAVRDVLATWRSILRSSAERPGAPETSALAMARELSLGEMIEIRGRLRRGDRAGARAAWVTLARGIVAFLDEMAGLTERGVG